MLFFTGQIDLTTANCINQASVLTLSKQSAGSGSKQNFPTTTVAENVSGDPSSNIAGEHVWANFGYFGQLRTEYNLEKVNFPENALFYINQVYLTVQKSKKIFYAVYFLLGQIHESSNQPSNIRSYECKEDEVKYEKDRYEKDTGKFIGLYETIGFLVVRGDSAEVFLSYGYDNEKSKILYSNFKHKIPSSFSGTLSNRHIRLIESSDNLQMSQLFFFSLL